MMNRKFLEAVLSIKEKNRFAKGIFQWVGFNVKWIGHENVNRVAGELVNGHYLNYLLIQ